jgi:hypothetical protein
LNTRARSLEELHAGFLTILPRIQLHGQIYFRHKPRHQRDELVAQMIALSWTWYVRLAARGKDAGEFPTALARYAAQSVHSGRRLCGQEKAKDVLSPRAQQRHRFTVLSLPSGSSLDGNIFDDALQDNTQTPVPEQVHFRLDYPVWRLSRSDRDRRIIADLMVGERTSDVAQRRGLTAARISQFRRAYHDDWRRFCGLDDDLPS